MSSLPEQDVRSANSTQDEVDAAESLIALSAYPSTADEPTHLSSQETEPPSSPATSEASSSTLNAEKSTPAERRALRDIQDHISSHAAPQLKSDPNILNAIWLVRSAWEYERRYPSRPSDMLLHLFRITWNCLHFRVRGESAEVKEKAERIHEHVEALQEIMPTLCEMYIGEERCLHFVEMLDEVTEMVLSADCSGWLRRGEVWNLPSGWMW